MNPSKRIEIIVIRLATFFKPFIIAVIFMTFLHVTGLFSSVSSASNWLILQTGLKDAGPTESSGRTSDNKDATEEDFNFHFTLQDLQGTRIPFEQFRGKVIFLNLWATWCGPCRAEMAG